MTHRTLGSYRLLGRSGLRVSPLSLGTMTFGDDWGWGAPEDEARRIFDTYVDRGGNFIDTANMYTNGTSERLLGKFVSGKRDELVLATKFTVSRRQGDPNAGGNHRKSLMQSVEASLTNLGTDYIDLLYLHVWDGTTEPEEILRSLDHLVRQGKVLYIGISDTPAWQVSRMQAIADVRGWSPFAALQIEYSLAERTVERDLIPMASEMGLGVIPWSPLAAGVLTGKYNRSHLNSKQAEQSGTRFDAIIAHNMLTERKLRIADEVKAIALELNKSPAQVALAWTLLNPAVSSTIVGARTLQQLEENLGALEIELADDQINRLDTISGVELGFPHGMIQQPALQQLIFGGTSVERRA